MTSPAILSFENTFMPSQFVASGVITTTEGPGGDALNLNAVRTDQTVTLTYDWTQSGNLVPLLNPASKWQFEIFLEAMGLSEFGPIAPQTIYYACTAGPHTISVTIAANTVPDGVYRVTARLMLLTPPALTASCIVAFADLGFANWYKG